MTRWLSLLLTLLAASAFGYAPEPKFPITSDLNGNLRTSGQVLDYDDENQLVRVTVTNQFKKEFVYDGANRLRVKREFAWSGGWTQTNETHFVCDGVLPIQHRDSNNVPTLTLTRGLDLSLSLQGAGGIGGLLAMTESSGTSSFYHNDGGGNVTALINVNQLLVGKYLYDPFGYPLSYTGPKATVNQYWFSSELWDADTGFLHYPRRVYVPALQRFANADPLGEVGGINLFQFVDNNPADEIDVSGLAGLRVNGKKSKVNTKEEFFNAITGAASGDGSIKSVQYSGHGDTQGGLALSDKDALFYNDMKNWLKDNAKLFDKNVKFELDACGTANPNFEGRRVADALKESLPDSSVWGFTGLDLWGIGVPNNKFFGRDEKVNGKPDSKIPKKSVWVEVKVK